MWTKAYPFGNSLLLSYFSPKGTNSINFLQNLYVHPDFRASNGVKRKKPATLDNNCLRNLVLPLQETGHQDAVWEHAINLERTPILQF